MKINKRIKVEYVISIHEYDRRMCAEDCEYLEILSNDGQPDNGRTHRAMCRVFGPSGAPRTDLDILDKRASGGGVAILRSRECVTAEVEELQKLAEEK